MTIGGYFVHHDAKIDKLLFELSSFSGRLVRATAIRDELFLCFATLRFHLLLATCLVSGYTLAVLSDETSADPTPQRQVVHPLGQLEH